MNPAVNKLLLGGLEETGHRMITGLLWSATIAASLAVMAIGKECIVWISRGMFPVTEQRKIGRSKESNHEEEMAIEPGT